METQSVINLSRDNINNVVDSLIHQEGYKTDFLNNATSLVKLIDYKDIIYDDTFDFNSLNRTIEKNIKTEIIEYYKIVLKLLYQLKKVNNNKLSVRFIVKKLYERLGEVSSSKKDKIKEELFYTIFFSKKNYLIEEDKFIKSIRTEFPKTFSEDKIDLFLYYYPEETKKTKDQFLIVKVDLDTFTNTNLDINFNVKVYPVRDIYATNNYNEKIKNKILNNNFYSNNNYGKILNNSFFNKNSLKIINNKRIENINLNLNDKITLFFKNTNTKKNIPLTNIRSINESISRITINKSNSIIKVFIYHIKVNKNKTLKEKYSFKKLKKINNISPEIKSIEFNGNKANNSSNLFFTKNIIEDIKNNTDKNILNNIKDNDDIIVLYEEYYTLSARLNFAKGAMREFKKNVILYEKLKNKIYEKIINLLEESTKIMKEYIKQNSNNKINNITDNNNIILRLKEKDTSKIIVMGDQHGSFHSFFRIIIRLKIMNIIDKNYKLKDGYKIIFLGDILDRGLFAIEILYIIFKLITSNNTANELKIIFNRGNHEEIETFSGHGFVLEFFKIIEFLEINNINNINNNDYNNINKKKKNIKNKFQDFFKYCSSAIILEQCNVNYWLCHGGFSTNISLLDSIKNNPNDKIYIIDNNNKNKISEIRWNDFSNTFNNNFSVRDEKAGTMHIIGTDTLNKFKEYLNINFIIRGHTDNESNAMILSTKNNSTGSNPEWFHINNNKQINKYIKDDLNKLILYNNLNLSKKSDNEIAIINPINFNNESILYPVLTISNNCDNLRDLYNDSYIMIESNY